MDVLLSSHTTWVVKILFSIKNVNAIVFFCYRVNYTTVLVITWAHHISHIIAFLTGNLGPSHFEPSYSQLCPLYNYRKIRSAQLFSMQTSIIIFLIVYKVAIIFIYATMCFYLKAFTNIHYVVFIYIMTHNLGNWLDLTNVL